MVWSEDCFTLRKFPVKRKDHDSPSKHLSRKMVEALEKLNQGNFIQFDLEKAMMLANISGNENLK